MKKLIFGLAVTVVAALSACSKDSGNSNPTGQTCVNGVCYATNSNYNTCGANSGYPSAYGPYQMIGSQCMDTTRNVVVQPQLCPNGGGLNAGYNPGYNPGYGGVNSGYGGLNQNIYSPYCNPYGGYQPYMNPAGNYPYSGVCPMGSMQIFDPRTGVTNCMPWSNYGQISPYAQPNYYGGSMWF